ncbi:pentatricopeptide repeat-containing protein At1g02150-like [Impatiens glandulifera]|uniref:pentatricopeptide repeat-containing protein At1g02150-like n=1 Tax=Impatiens glandulifera TaxID=253017 RepID=UPI001FB12CBB|nr:pentatricopeptide repeat-containing protein At1g02150-like [Impatiens glandulifera]XP_047340822.1 pentatricopeptide repeat-containing protein At1g02150-like [Impatiens glandulifera]
MMLQSTVSQSLLQNRHVYLSSSTSHSSSLPSTFRGSVSFQGVNNIGFPVVRYKISNAFGNKTVDYEKRPPQQLKWNGIFKKLSLMEDPKKGAASVLNHLEKEGKLISKWELSRVIKELRKFRRFKIALEVYQWMNNRAERFRTTSSDTALQLDLIAKVHGIAIAEEYFQKLPDKIKDKRTYGALLNSYGKIKMKEKAELLLDDMKSKGYANHCLPMNVMMTMYMSLKEFDQVDAIISDMKQKRLPLDLYSYNIWLSSYGSRDSVEGMERVFNEMQQDATINPNWTTFSTMATMYIKLRQHEKGVICLKEVESRITGRDRIPYHYLISLYGNMGNKEEVGRIWGIYKSIFPIATNLGYHTMISSLVRLDDIEWALTVYEEWLSVKTSYDPRIVNLLMGWHVRNGKMEKAEELFNHMAKTGGKPNAASWEILAEGRIQENRGSDALSCLKEAVATIVESNNWKPKPVNVASILKLCEKEEDSVSKEGLFELMKKTKCFEDAGYMSYIPLDGKEFKMIQAEAGDDDYEEHNQEGEDVEEEAETLVIQL